MDGIKLTLFPKKYVLISLFILSFFVFIFSTFAIKLNLNDLNSFDDLIYTWLEAFMRPELRSVMTFITFLGSTVALISLCVITASLMVWQHKRWEALFLGISILGGVLFNQWLKHMYQRERPTVHQLIIESGYSFPSGHSMVSFVFYGMLAMLLIVFFKSKAAKMIVITSAVALITLIGFSRIYLGVHYPSDVFAGFAAGGAWVACCLIGLKLVLTIRSHKRES